MTTKSLTNLEKQAISNYVTVVWPHHRACGIRTKGPHHASRACLWEMAGNSHDMQWLRSCLASEITKVCIQRGAGYSGLVEFVPAQLVNEICSIRNQIQF